MEYVILGLLLVQDMSLYDLQKSFKAGISLFYSASYGSIQRTVRKLVEQGLVSFKEEVASGRNRKVHRIEASGKKAFFQWMESPILKGNKLETHALIKLFFLGQIKNKEIKAEILDQITKAIKETLDELKETKKQLLDSFPGVNEHPEYKYQIKTLDYGIMSHQAALDWFIQERQAL